MNPTDAEDAVAAYIHFREKVQQAGLRMEPATIILLMIAERLNQIGRRLDDIDESIDERK
jgi:hypothetical protein